MTPLPARAFVSRLFVPAALMLSMARENDRTRVLFGVPMLLLILRTVTLQIARFAKVSLFSLYGLTLAAFVPGVFRARGGWRTALQ